MQRIDEIRAKILRSDEEVREEMHLEMQFA